MLIELVKPGEYGQAGSTTIISEKDILELKDTFKADVPITLGHNLADFMPALGWIKSVDINDKSLIGDIELTDLLKDAYDKGLYKKWSIGIRKDAQGKKYLHHLAFLGEVPPKIKDLKTLKSIEMSDCSETWLFEFADKPPSLASLEIVDRPWNVDEARKRIFDKYGIDGLKEYCLYKDPEADSENKTAYKFLVVDIVDQEPKIISKALSAALAYLHGARGINIPETVRQKVEPEIRRLLEKKKEEEEMADNEELKKQKEKADKLEGEIRALKKDMLKAVMIGKIPQAKHGLVMELADRLDIEEQIELADGDKKRKVSLFDLLVEVIKGIPMAVKPGEMDMGDKDNKDKGIDARKVLNRI